MLNAACPPSPKFSLKANSEIVSTKSQFFSFQMKEVHHLVDGDEEGHRKGWVEVVRRNNIYHYMMIYLKIVIGNNAVGVKIGVIIFRKLTVKIPI